ncbi:MAG TPA: hypothetical protein VMT21_01610 [Gemmatimonadales bacterium]|nr:hypothetical protein [Gemmatimonadales bacterium]
MRASTAVLTETSIRLWDLAFPYGQALVARTRAPYIALDNLIAFSKQDRDGKVNAYLAAYLPDELVLLFFESGELVNAALLNPAGRFPVAIGDALRRIREGTERAEIAFHAAPQDLLAAMYAACSGPPLQVALDPRSPETVFRTLFEQKWSGLLELISNGRVNYLQVKDGRFASGHFAERVPNDPPLATVARLFASTPPEPLPRVVAKLYDGPPPLPRQAPPAMIQMFRRYTWDLADLIEREAPGQGAKRAERVRQRLLPQHQVLQWVGGTRGAAQEDPVVEPVTLADGVATWTKELLTEVEVLQPQSAPRILRDAAREHRFALNAVGFFEKLPWRIQW